MLSGSPSWRVRAAARIGAVAIVGLTASTALAGPAGADGANSFDGTATGYAFDVVIANNSIPAGISPEVDGPSAQGHLDSLGDSDAFAAFPYLGDDVTGAPGLASGLTGIPLPSDPLYTSTSAGDKPKTVSEPGVSLAAESDPGNAHASAATGAGSTGSTTTSSVGVNPDQSVVARTEAGVNGLDVGGVVTVDGVDAKAEADRDTSGALTTSSSLAIGHISVPGAAVTLPDCLPSTVPVPLPGVSLPTLPSFCLSSVPGAASLAGKTLSNPDVTLDNGQFSVTVFPEAGGPSVSIPLPVSTVEQAFAAAGVTMTVQQPMDLKDASGAKDGIVGASVTFVSTLPAPPPPVSSEISGPTTLTERVGDVSAHVDYTVIADQASGSDFSLPSSPATGTTGSTGPSGTAPGVSTAPATGSAGAPKGSTSGLPAGTGDTSGGTALAAGTPDSSVASAAAPTVGGAVAAGAAPVGTSAAALRTSDNYWLANIYPVLVVAGLVAYAFTHFARSSGRRFRWIS